MIGIPSGELPKQPISAGGQTPNLLQWILMASIIPILVSILGLSFLIFIHELGHFWMARRVGMKVETFSIGFGKPIVSWMKDGVKWQICWFLLGGYVKIAGTDTEEKIDPYLVKDGFFGKRPLDRIKVAFMGPAVNLAFAFLIFVLLFAIGGRSKSFFEHTNKIGWVDTESELYQAGLRPGDEIISYDGVAYNSATDHLTFPIMSAPEVTISAQTVSYAPFKKQPLEKTVKVYPHPHPKAIEEKLLTAGIVAPASYIIYDKHSNGEENPLPEGSSLKRSGIEYGDRLVWVNGQKIFSLKQLKEILNDNRALLTIQRGDEVLLRRAPRVQAGELRLPEDVKEELVDWKFEAGLNETKLKDLWVLPYNLSYDCTVEEQIKFIDSEVKEQAFPKTLFSKTEEPLKPGDKILSVQGTPIRYAYQLLSDLQLNRANVIVQREDSSREPVAVEEADALFDASVNWADLERLASSIGTAKQLTSVGSLYLLKPVTPKPYIEFLPTEEMKSLHAAEQVEKKRLIETLEDPEMRTRLFSQLESQNKELVLGFGAQDQRVVYNPNPIEQFNDSIRALFRTFGALFTGAMSVKHLSGPVGIVDVVQRTSSSGIPELLFWLAFISLNLGFINLLPIPVLDGGTIVFSFIEMITGKRFKPQTLEKVMLFFMLLFILLALLLTYQDVMRIVGRFFV